MEFQISSRRETGLRDTSVIKVRVLKNSFSNVALSDADNNAFGLPNRRGTFVKETISNSAKVLRAEFLGKDTVFYSISICKFGSLKNPFATITSLSELYFRFRRFILSVQIKKVIPMN